MDELADARVTGQNRRVAASYITRPDLKELDWSAAHRAESLSAVYAHSTGYGTATESWYAEKRRPKRVLGRLLRAGAIVLGAVAAILPILGQIDTHDGKPSIPPAWASVALAAAAAFVALDRFFGFSTGWMRFMDAELHVTRLRHDFEYAWQEAYAKLADPPSEQDVAALLERARRFVRAVDDVIENETKSWIKEFQTDLAGGTQTGQKSEGSSG